MNQYILKNFWVIKRSDEFKNMAKKFKKDFPELKSKKKENDIQANLDSLLFIELKRRNDNKILEDYVQYSVRLNVKRNYTEQLLNERGIYRHKNKKTGERVWIQRSFANDKLHETNLEDVSYRQKREDDELRYLITSQLTEKEQAQLIAIESAKDGKEMAELMGVSESYARQIKGRLRKKVKIIMDKIRQEDVQEAC